MATKKISALERKVKEKLKLVIKIVNFVIWLLNKKGTVTKQHVSSCHTNTETELKNFNSFSFFGYFGHTMFGGNDIEIHYHQGKRRHPCFLCLLASLFH
jgi:hypothetical protein